MNPKMLVVCAVWTLVLAGGLAAPGAADGEYPISIPCARLEADISWNVHRVEGDLVLTMKYPLEIGASFGDERRHPVVDFYLDVDDDPKTGKQTDSPTELGANGSEFEVGTTVAKTPVAKDAEGNWINRPQFFVSIDQGEDSAELPEDFYPQWEFEVNGAFQEINWVEPQASNTMRLVVPLAVFGLEPGAKIRVIGSAPLCNTSFPFTATAEARVTLK